MMGYKEGQQTNNLPPHARLFQMTMRKVHWHLYVAALCGSPLTLQQAFYWQIQNPRAFVS